MKRLVPMFDNSGARYSIPEDRVDEFRADMGEVAEARRYRDKDGRHYTIPQDQDEAFRADMPDAVPVRSYTMADGTRRDFTMSEMSKFLRSKEYRESEDYTPPQMGSPTFAGVKGALTGAAEGAWEGGNAAANAIAKALPEVGIGIESALGHAANLGGNAKNAVGDWLVKNAAENKAWLDAKFPSEAKEWTGYEDWSTKIADKFGEMAAMTYKFAPGMSTMGAKAFMETVFASDGVNAAAQAFDRAKSPLKADGVTPKEVQSDTAANLEAAAAFLVNYFGGKLLMKGGAAAEGIKNPALRWLASGAATSGVMAEQSGLNKAIENIGEGETVSNGVLPAMGEGAVEGAIFHGMNALPGAIAGAYGKVKQSREQKAMLRESTMTALESGADGRNLLATLYDNEGVDAAIRARKEGRDVSRRMGAAADLPDNMSAAERNAVIDGISKAREARAERVRTKMDDVQAQSLADEIGQNLMGGASDPMFEDIWLNATRRVKDATELDEPGARARIVGEAIEDVVGKQLDAGPAKREARSYEEKFAENRLLRTPSRVGEKVIAEDQEARAMGRRIEAEGEAQRKAAAEKAKADYDEKMAAYEEARAKRAAEKKRGVAKEKMTPLPEKPTPPELRVEERKKPEIEADLSDFSKNPAKVDKKTPENAEIVSTKAENAAENLSPREKEDYESRYAKEKADFDAKKPERERKLADVNARIEENDREIEDLKKSFKGTDEELLKSDRWNELTTKLGELLKEKSSIEGDLKEPETPHDRNVRENKADIAYVKDHISYLKQLKKNSLKKGESAAVYDKDIAKYESFLKTLKGDTDARVTIKAIPIEPKPAKVPDGRGRMVEKQIETAKDTLESLKRIASDENVLPKVSDEKLIETLNDERAKDPKYADMIGKVKAELEKRGKLPQAPQTRENATSRAPQGKGIMSQAEAKIPDGRGRMAWNDEAQARNAVAASLYNTRGKDIKLADVSIEDLKKVRDQVYRTESASSVKDTSGLFESTLRGLDAEIAKRNEKPQTKQPSQTRENAPSSAPQEKGITSRPEGAERTEARNGANGKSFYERKSARFDELNNRDGNYDENGNKTVQGESVGAYGTIASKFTDKNGKISISKSDEKYVLQKISLHSPSSFVGDKARNASWTEGAMLALKDAGFEVGKNRKGETALVRIKSPSTRVPDGKGRMVKKTDGNGVYEKIANAEPPIGLHPKFKKQNAAEMAKIGVLAKDGKMPVAIEGFDGGASKPNYVEFKYADGSSQKVYGDINSIKKWADGVGLKPSVRPAPKAKADAEAKTKNSIVDADTARTDENWGFRKATNAIEFQEQMDALKKYKNSIVAKYPQEPINPKTKKPYGKSTPQYRDYLKNLKEAREELGREVKRVEELIGEENPEWGDASEARANEIVEKFEKNFDKSKLSERDKNELNGLIDELSNALREIELDELREITDIDGEISTKGIYRYEPSEAAVRVQNAYDTIKLFSEQAGKYQRLKRDADGRPIFQINEATPAQKLADPDFKAWARKQGRTPTDGARRIYDAQRVDAVFKVAKNWLKGVKMRRSENAAEVPNGARMSIVEDGEILKELDNGETITLYRAMQLGEDGQLRPPMSGKVEGKWREGEPIGKWQQSEERPDLVDKDGNFTLNKGKKSIKAKYNPYFHQSDTPLNDQFAEAYKRPELVIVEVEIPKSELTSGYRAEKAKDAVGGPMKWKGGPVDNALPSSDKRGVYLSRFTKIKRIVPDSEAAKIVAEKLKRNNVSVPDNVVTPSMRKALEAEGVKISESGKIRYLYSRDGNVVGWYDRAKKELVTLPGADAATVAHELGWHATYDYAQAEAAQGRTALLDKLNDYANNAPQSVKNEILRKYGMATEAEVLLDEIGAARYTMDNVNKIKDAATRRQTAKWYQRTWNAIADTYKAMLSKLGWNKARLDNLSALTPEETVNLLADEMLKGRNLGKAKSTQIDMSKGESIAQLHDRKFKDRLRPIEEIEKDAGKSVGNSAYTLFRTLPGKVQGAIDKAQNFAEKVKADCKKAGIKIEELNEFLYASAASERNAKVLARNGRLDGSAMSHADIQRILSAYRNSPKYAELRRIADDVLAFQRKGFDFRRKAGLISDETWNTLLADEPNHVPMKNRFDPNGEHMGFSLTEQFGKPEWKTAEGRTNVGDGPLEWIVQEYVDAFSRGHENVARRALLETVLAHPEVGEVKKLGPNDALGEMKRKGQQGDPNVFVVKTDGDTYQVKLNGTRGELIARAVSGRGLVRSPQSLQKAMRWWSATATSWSPTFAGRNFIEDTVDVFAVNIGEKGIIKGLGASGKHVKTALKLTNAIRKYASTGETTDPLIREAVDAGVLMGGGVRGQAFADAGEEALKTLKTDWRNGKNRVKAIRDVMFGWIDTLNQTAELMNRMADYKLQMESLSKANNALPQNRRRSLAELRNEAALHAREITVDFNQKGELTPVTNMLYMFSNSTLGATMRLGKAIFASKEGKSLAAGTFALGLIEGTVEALANGDDEDGKNMNEYTRANSFYFRKGKDIYRIPIHASPISVIKYAGNCTARKLFGTLKGDKAAEQIAKDMIGIMTSYLGIGALGDNEAASIAPTIVQPFLQAYMNLDFADRPIERTSFSEEKPKSGNGRPSTPQFYHDLAKWLNEFGGGNAGRKGEFLGVGTDFSPEMLKHFSEATGKNALRDIENTVEFAKMVLGKTDWDRRKIPFVRDYFHITVSNDNRFFEAVRAYKTDASDFKERTGADRKKFEDSHPWLKEGRDGRTTVNRLINMTNRDNPRNGVATMGIIQLRKLTEGKIRRNDGTYFKPNTPVSDELKEKAKEWLQKRQARVIEIMGK